MTAIFIGRFQPFHKGHLAAIRWILKKEKKVIIVIGSNQRFLTKENTFSFFERKRVLKKTLLKEGVKNFKIFGVHDYNDDIFWAKKVLNITKTDSQNATIFTRNSWTKKCFKKIEVKVKPHPLYFDRLSATKIRKKIVKNENWKNLVPRPVFCFLKRINGEKRIKSLNKNAN